MALQLSPDTEVCPAVLYEDRLDREAGSEGSRPEPGQVLPVSRGAL